MAALTLTTAGLFRHAVSLQSYTRPGGGIV